MPKLYSSIEGAESTIQTQSHSVKASELSQVQWGLTGWADLSFPTRGTEVWLLLSLVETNHLVLCVFLPPVCFRVLKFCCWASKQHYYSAASPMPEGIARNSLSSLQTRPCLLFGQHCDAESNLPLFVYLSTESFACKQHLSFSLRCTFFLFIWNYLLSCHIPVSCWGND